MSKLIETLSADFVTRYARDLYHCSSCNYCVDAVWPERGMQGVCATMEQHTRAPGYSGRGYIEAARAIIEGQALDGAALAERVFTCTTCGNCETVCPIGLRPASVGRALREELLAADCLPAPLAAARDSFIAHGNPYGLPRAQRHAWAAALEHERGRRPHAVRGLRRCPAGGRGGTGQPRAAAICGHRGTGGDGRLLWRAAQ